jgi:glycopeptide antibiotics resistance protein
VLAYALLMFWFCQLYLNKILYGAGFIAMGVALEVLQGMSGLRSYEMLDMLANAAGVILGWLAARVLPPLLPRP